MKSSEGVVVLNTKLVTVQLYCGSHEFDAQHNKPDITIIGHVNQETFIV